MTETLRDLSADFALICHLFNLSVHSLPVFLFLAVVQPVEDLVYDSDHMIATGCISHWGALIVIYAVFQMETKHILGSLGDGTLMRYTAEVQCAEELVGCLDLFPDV